MSVPVIGVAAAAPTTPPTPGAAPAPGALPFMLLPMVSLPVDAPAAADASSPEATSAEAPPDEAEAPLIGWLFDSFALAAAPTTPTPTLTATPVPTTAVGLAMADPAAAPAGAQPRPAPAADIVAAMVAERVGAALPERRDPVAESILPTPVPLVQAGVENPSNPVLNPVPIDPANTAIPLTGAALPMIAPSPTSAPAPIDGMMPPLVADGPELAAELGERIAWQMDQGLGEATIELHPAELGALTIRIETQAQQAQVHILAAEPAARALLSQCLPQLRDLLGASGLTLTRGQVDVAERRGESGADLPTPRNGRRRISSVTLVDTYA